MAESDTEQLNMLPSEKNKKNPIIITKVNKIVNNDEGNNMDQCNEQQLILNDKYKQINNNELLETKNNKGVFHQILMTCAVLILTCACGMPIGYSAVILPQLYNSSDPLSFDIEMGSWITSVHSAATPIGSFASGPIMDRWGRRPALLFAVLPLIIGWTCLATASSHILLVVGRVIAGISVGLIAAPAQVLIAEIAEPHLRGILIGVPFVSYSMGILFVYALGSQLHWREVAWCGLLLPIISFIVLLLTPESPVWLTRNGYIEKAMKALQWLRGSNGQAKIELNELIGRFENEKLQPEHTEGFFKTLARHSVVKPLIIINGFHLLQVISGTYLIVFYAVDIISELGGEVVNTLTAAVLTAAVRLVFTVLYCFFLLYVKRRTMIIGSGLGSGISATFLAVYLYCTYGKVKTSLDIYISAICILVYIGSNTGFMVLPGIMLGELLPAKIRGQIAGYLISLLNLCLFIAAKGFPYANQTLKTRGLFLVFGLASLTATLFLYILLPETKGKTLAEIEDYFKQKNWLWLSRKSDQKKKKTLSK